MCFSDSAKSAAPSQPNVSYRPTPTHSKPQCMQRLTDHSAHMYCLCFRYGLAIGYYCAWLVRVLMAATSPISWPIGKLLDFLLGSDHRALFRCTWLPSALTCDVTAC